MPGIHSSERRAAPGDDARLGAVGLLAYGAGFDRQTEKHVPEAGLQLVEIRFVADELIKLLAARA
jgi:hypothetical protein